MNAESEERDDREAQFHEALDDVVRSAFVGNIASAAREYIAEEDFGAMLDAIVSSLDEAGLHLVERPEVARARRRAIPRADCNWPRCHRHPNPCFAWCKCVCHSIPDPPTRPGGDQGGA